LAMVPLRMCRLYNFKNSIDKEALQIYSTQGLQHLKRSFLN